MSPVFSSALPKAIPASGPAPRVASGYLLLALHAHLPFIRHPEYEDFLEEDWLHEAITETYIPLLHTLDDFARDGVYCRLTLSLTPPLCEMLADPLLQERYIKHIERLIELADREVHRTRSLPEFHESARMYQRKFRAARETFVERCGRDLIGAFRAFQDAGQVEIITSGATHGFLPLLHVSPSAVRAQIHVARDNYRKHFGRPPRGIWNSECGYYPGLDQALAEAGLDFFFVDSHGLLHADPAPRRGVFAPARCSGGTAAFARDPASSKSVWSATEGYPADPVYREFYHDAGYELDFEYIAPFVHESGMRIPTGVKYYRITDREGGPKQPYDERAALARAAEHARHFVEEREVQMRRLGPLLDRPPLAVSPYDAELFGHWWYEGPDFLNAVFRELHARRNGVLPVTPAEYLERHPDNQMLEPSFSSWGLNGYAQMWLNGTNDWIYRHLHEAADRMAALVKRQFHEGGILSGKSDRSDPSDPSDLSDQSDRSDKSDSALHLRALKQAGRELLLAQSSDWAFILSANTTASYAARRAREHLLRFNDLNEMLESRTIDRERLEDYEHRDNIFPELNVAHFA